MNNKSTKHTKVLILGSGPAGYTAAIYAARAMLKPILVYGSQPGGQLTTTTDVENYPGYSKVIQGPWLMEEMKGQAEAVGTEMIQDHISKVDLSKKPFEAIGDSGQVYTADSFIISTGAQARWLNLKSEQEFRGFGVSACATCDGFFFKEKEVAVVGGGNAAVEEAMFLTKFASKVYLIHRRNELRAEKMLQEKLKANKKIEIIWDSAVDEVIGTAEPKVVNALKIKNLKTNSITDLKIDGLFIAIGHDPATALFKNQLDMDKEGYLITKSDSTETNVPGVFAAGDVKDKVFRQAVTAAGMGCMSALEAEKYLSSK
ncbi:thioredoxin-disulfide reductase [Candidatus Pelagibacter bacterium]|nr:thioredoxin-disulfide reductase [Pelagibacteraceae bacterium]MDA8763914.1 thioredoxin-disulfide reductase [Candidatus Pelagibacter bacterium]MDC0858646.1 thioredoxin-disulfide reductase [Pelagibacteraceae bacterium]